MKQQELPFTLRERFHFGYLHYVYEEGDSKWIAIFKSLYNLLRRK